MLRTSETLAACTVVAAGYTVVVVAAAAAVGDKGRIPRWAGGAGEQQQQQ